MTALPHHCPRCDGRWNGLNTAHCGADGCHQTFTGPTAFDAHRARKFTDDTRHCVDPATVGLVKFSRDYPCWALPGTNDRFSVAPEEDQ